MASGWGRHSTANSVEIPKGRIFLLPLDQFAFAKLDNDGKKQRLHLSYATHEIMVRGHALRRIETALHRLELSSITPLPPKYHPLVAEGQPGFGESWSRK